LIATIDQPAVIARILAHLGLPSECPEAFKLLVRFVRALCLRHGLTPTDPVLRLPPLARVEFVTWEILPEDSS
jgi:hypothetical protein